MPEIMQSHMPRNAGLPQGPREVAMRQVVGIERLPLRATEDPAEMAHAAPFRESTRHCPNEALHLGLVVVMLDAGGASASTPRAGRSSATSGPRVH
jgi:hypothetical protein